MDKGDINKLNPLADKFPMIITVLEKGEKKLDEFKKAWVEFMKTPGRKINIVDSKPIVTENLKRETSILQGFLGEAVRLSDKLRDLRNE